MSIKQSMQDIDRAVEDAIGTDARERYRNDSRSGNEGRSQRRAYEKSLEEVRDLAGEAPAQRLATWIETRIRDAQKLPTSRRVRKKGAEICRDAGESVSTNDWLGA